MGKEEVEENEKKKIINKRFSNNHAIVTVALGAWLSQFPNPDNYEVRTMNVYGENDTTTFLIDGNNEIYAMNDKVFESHKSLLVTIDNRGTQNLKDDVIVGDTKKDGERG